MAIGSDAVATAGSIQELAAIRDKVIGLARETVCDLLLCFDKDQHGFPSIVSKPKKGKDGSNLRKISLRNSAIVFTALNKAAPLLMQAHSKKGLLAAILEDYKKSGTC